MRDIAAPFHGARVSYAGDAAVWADKNSWKVDGFTRQNVDHLVGSNDSCLRLCCARQKCCAR